MILYDVRMRRLDDRNVAFIECNAVVFFSFLCYFSVFFSVFQTAVFSALASLSCPQLSVNYKLSRCTCLLRQIKID